MPDSFFANSDAKESRDVEGVVPGEILHWPTRSDVRLSGDAKLLYGYLWQRCGKQPGTHRASLVGMAEFLQSPPAKVERQLRKLQSAGLIQPQQDDGTLELQLSDPVLATQTERYSIWN